MPMLMKLQTRQQGDPRGRDEVYDGDNDNARAPSADKQAQQQKHTVVAGCKMRLKVIANPLLHAAGIVQNVVVIDTVYIHLHVQHKCCITVGVQPSH